MDMFSTSFASASTSLAPFSKAISKVHPPISKSCATAVTTPTSPTSPCSISDSGLSPCPPGPRLGSFAGGFSRT
eukprot:1177276-Prorocentrum_minimum.AAC.2